MTFMWCKMKSRKIDKTFPDALHVALRELGSDLQAARRSRRMSRAELAQRVGVGRNTIVRLEAGDHKVSLGALMASAWVLGLEKNLAQALSPEADPAFLRLARLNLPEKIRAETASDPDFDF